MGKALRILRRELAGVLKNLYWLLLYAGVMKLTAFLPPVVSTVAPQRPTTGALVILRVRVGVARP